MSDIPQPTDEDRKFIEGRGWGRYREHFWVNMSNLGEVSYAQTHVEGCPQYILTQVRKGHDAPQLYKDVENYDHKKGEDTSVAKWLLAFLRVNKAIPEQIVSVARNPNGDSKLIDPAEPRQSILKMLSKIRGNEIDDFHGLKYTSKSNAPDGTGYAHYIGNPSFRHGGLDQESPPTVFVQKHAVPATTTDNRVHVYYQESGSGKTVELAASAYTRNALFTIVRTFDWDVTLITDDHVGLKGNSNAEDRDTIRKRFRRTYSLWSLAFAIIGNWEDRPEYKRLTKFIQDLDASRKGNGRYDMETLHVVLAIDEAGNRPNLAKAVIQDYADFGRMLGTFIMHGCPDSGLSCQDNSVGTATTPALLKVEALKNPLETLTVNVLFSIAGTGASHAIVGSSPENFIHLTPTAKVEPEEVYDILRQGYTKRRDASIIPQYGELQQFPLLKAVVDSNARMTSIYMDCANRIQDNNKNTNKKGNAHAQEQSDLLSRTFVRFMESNGMFWLSRESPFARLTAHRAIAVLLFQQNTPFLQGLKDIHVDNMDYGITLERVMEDNNERTIMGMLVSRFGLLTAKPFQSQSENKPDASPFDLSDAMQLLCLWLIQGGEEVPKDKSFLGTTSTSFATLTGLLVGAAVGASAVVKKDKNGRVLAAPAENYDHGTTVQQEADIMAALGKVGMAVTETIEEDDMAGAAAAPPSSYTCETTAGPKPVMKIICDQFWSLKGAHAVFLLEGPHIPGVYFHKSMMTSVTTDADKERLKAAAETGSGAFRNMNQSQFDEGGNLQVTPLYGVGSDAIQQTLESNHSILADEDLLRIHSKLRRLEKRLSGPARTSQHTTRGVVKDAFRLPFISIAEGKSDLADVYVTFLVESLTTESHKKRHSLRTICIKAKDYANGTSPDMGEYLNNAVATTSPGLDPLFGEDRIFTVAGAQETVAWDYQLGEFPYVPFVVDKSTILKNQMVALSQGCYQVAKQGEHAALLDGPVKDEASHPYDSLNQEPGHLKQGKNER